MQNITAGTVSLSVVFFKYLFNNLLVMLAVNYKLFVVVEFFFQK
jgi:hypothetical protein